jgi:hypothetical protein
MMGQMKPGRIARALITHEPLSNRLKETFTGNPLLVHCAMGLSRSPAAALGILYYAKKKSVPAPVDFSMTWLNQLADFNLTPLLAKLMIEAIEPSNPKVFELFQKHPFWKAQPAQDLYSRLLPKPKRTQ